MSLISDQIMNSNSAKSNKSTKSRGVRNQISTSRAPTKRGRRKLPTGVPINQGITRLPAIFRTGSDVNSMRLNGSLALANTSSGLASHVISVAPTSSGNPAYWGLANFFPMLSGLRDQYARYMVTRLLIQAAPVTAAVSGGYVVVGYQPDDANTSGPPVSVSDVTSALHSDLAQVTEIAGFELNVSDYYNDWRQCTPLTGSSTFASSAGVVQVLGANAITETTGAVMLMHIEVDIHFTGYRKVN